MLSKVLRVQPLSMRPIAYIFYTDSLMMMSADGDYYTTGLRFEAFRFSSRHLPRDAAFFQAEYRGHRRQSHAHEFILCFAMRRRTPGMASSRYHAPAPGLRV